jgi:hypothetical protein
VSMIFMTCIVYSPLYRPSPDKPRGIEPKTNSMTSTVSLREPTLQPFFLTRWLPSTTRFLQQLATSRLRPGRATVTFLIWHFATHKSLNLRP